ADGGPGGFDGRFKDGEQAAWREYTFRFDHLPGQTEFTMGVETKIDGKKCFFTADNWFHQDQFSGTGGWMGLNRSWPLPYAESAQKVLDAAPDWVLAEHGGPFEFDREDWRRRGRWGEEGAKAADGRSPGGSHRPDGDPDPGPGEGPARGPRGPVGQEGEPGAAGEGPARGAHAPPPPANADGGARGPRADAGPIVGAGRAGRRVGAAPGEPPPGREGAGRAA